jgi:hypothetical protein
MTNPYKNLPSDTPEHVLQMQVDIVLKKSLTERVQMCADMAQFSIDMIKRKIKEERPNISTNELKFELVKAMYSDCYSDEEMARIKDHFMNLPTTDI